MEVKFIFCSNKTKWFQWAFICHPKGFPRAFRREAASFCPYFGKNNAMTQMPCKHLNLKTHNAKTVITQQAAIPIKILFQISFKH